MSHPATGGSLAFWALRVTLGARLSPNVDATVENSEAVAAGRAHHGVPPLNRSGAAATIDFITTDNALPAPNPEPDPVVVTFGPNPAPIPAPLVATQRVPDPIVDFSTTGSDKLDVRILGYVAVPQGHVRLDANDPTNKLVAMIGGLVAGQVRLDGTGQAPAVLDVRFDNPIAQKRIRLTSTVAGSYVAVSETVVQINRSGSIGINSWIIQ